MAHVVEASELRKTYREGWLFPKKLTALRGVSLEVRRGEVFGLLGPNGAGKTTLIKILLGILHPTGGRAQILGLPAGSLAARSRIGYLPENMAFARHHSGLDAIYFFGRLSGLSERMIRQRYPALLELVGLSGREREPVRKYSKGMRQRLGLAQALLHDPDVMILDEPTDGLDPVGRSQVRQVLERLKSDGKTIFLNSHILQEVELVCDRVAIMARGQIHEVGTIGEVVARHPDSQRWQLHLELGGQEAAIKPVVEPWSSGTLKRLGDALWRWDLEVGSQGEVDRLVDQLRQAGVSLMGLQRQLPRLEEVFLRIVTEASGAAMAGGES
jgi:ABC-2 type transport system ATP-binding protein